METKNQNNIKRLYRSQEDKMLAGVCGGIAEYLNTDPVWIRLIAIFLIFLEGAGLLIYIILWLLIPENPNHNTQQTHNKNENKNKKTINTKQNENNQQYILGSLLILIGIIFLIKPYLYWLTFKNLWPLSLIAIGLILLLRRP